MVCCSAKRDEMVRMGRSSEELKDKCLFICCKTDDQVAQIAAQGIVVNASNFCSLGKFNLNITCILSTVLWWLLFTIVHSLHEVMFKYYIYTPWSMGWQPLIAAVHLLIS